MYRNNINICLKKITKYSKLSDNELKKLQDEKLSQILIYSYKNVPYYTEILEKAGVVNEKLEVNLENFEKIPILTKQLIRDRFNDLKSKEINKLKWKYNSTGGSTGEPVKLIQDETYYDWNVANKLFYKQIACIKLGSREIRLWGSGNDILNCSFVASVRNKIYNRKDLKVYDMSEKKMVSHLKTWNKLKPVWVEGYVQAIYEFSVFIKKNNLKAASPKGILCTAGTMCPHMKKTIEETFKCKVYNRYGSREVGDVAFGEDELRVSVWNNKVEILDKKTNHKNKKGKVCITNLNNRAMPLIRYEIGDLAEAGKDWKTLKKIVGREISMFKKINGDLIDGSYFTLPISKIEYIRRYQVIQRDYNHVEYIFVIENKSRLSEKEENLLSNQAKKALGTDCIVTFTYTDNIKALDNGKYLYTKSEVNN